MEKRTPHSPLSVVRTLIQFRKVRSTYTALAGGAAMGFDFEGMIAVLLALTPKDFYKSMTTYSDDKIWQDVYRPTTKYGDVYLKLTAIDDVLIVSFKEL
jgi:motility quorum-sensing regulator/GCU-specific mRNA interferase toxin